MNKVEVCNNIFVDKIFCINLEHNKKRREKISKLFKKFNILDKITWFNAIYNKEKGNIGCRDSHLEIIKLAYLNHYESIMILEDDATFTEFPFKINNDIPNDWCMLYPGWLDIDLKSYKISNEIIRLKSARSTHCYIIRNNIIPYILRMGKCREHIDQFYWEVIQQTLPCYGLYPIRSLQDINISNISNHSNKVADDDMIINSNIIYNQGNCDTILKTNVWLNHYKNFMNIIKNKHLLYKDLIKINF